MPLHRLHQSLHHQEFSSVGLSVCLLCYAAKRRALPFQATSNMYVGPSNTMPFTNMHVRVDLGTTFLHHVGTLRPPITTFTMYVGTLGFQWCTWWNSEASVAQPRAWGTHITADACSAAASKECSTQGSR